MGLPILQARPTIASAIGSGLQQGFNVSLNQRIQEQQQQKQIEQQKAYNAEVNNIIAKSHPLLSEFVGKNNPMDPQQFMNLGKMLIEERTNQFSSEVNRALTGETAPPQDQYTFPQEPPSRRQLAPGTAPMLPQEQMPAEEEMSRLTPRSMQGMPLQQENKPPDQLRDQQPEKTPLEKYNDYKNKLNARAIELKKKAHTKQEAKFVDDEVKRLLSEAKAQAGLEQRDITTKAAEEKTKIAREKFEKEKQELPKPVLDKLISYQDAANRSGITIQATKNIDAILSSGAQMPQIVTALHNRLGPDNILTRMADALARDDKAPAVDAARIALLNEMKDIFGQVRVAEFQEYLKKLPSVTDPKISNKLKTALLRQLAKPAQFNLIGLQQAIKKDRYAPADVILNRAQNISNKLANDFYDSEKFHLDYILNTEKYKNMSFVTTPDGKPLVVPTENLDSLLNAMDSKGRKARLLVWE